MRFPFYFGMKGMRFARQGPRRGAGQVITVPADQVQLENNARFVAAAGLANQKILSQSHLLVLTEKH